MGIETGTALLVSSLIGGGAAAYGASKSASASKKAAETQVASANKAIDVSQQNYADAIAYLKEMQAAGQSAQAPYLATGTSALSTLARGMGLSVDPSVFDTSTATSGSGATSTAATAQATPAKARPRYPGTTLTDVALPGYVSGRRAGGTRLGVTTGADATGTAGARGATAAAATGTDSSLTMPGAAVENERVLMEAPDGSRRYVPRGQVAYYLARGAKTVGG